MEPREIEGIKHHTKHLKSRYARTLYGEVIEFRKWSTQVVPLMLTIFMRLMEWQHVSNNVEWPIHLHQALYYHNIRSRTRQFGCWILPNFPVHWWKFAWNFQLRSIIAENIPKEISPSCVTNSCIYVLKLMAGMLQMEPRVLALFSLGMNEHRIHPDCRRTVSFVQKKSPCAINQFLTMNIHIRISL